MEADHLFFKLHWSQEEMGRRYESFQSETESRPSKGKAATHLTQTERRSVVYGPLQQFWHTKVHRTTCENDAQSLRLRSLREVCRALKIGLGQGCVNLHIALMLTEEGLCISHQHMFI